MNKNSFMIKSLFRLPIESFGQYLYRRQAFSFILLGRIDQGPTKILEVRSYCSYKTTSRSSHMAPSDDVQKDLPPQTDDGKVGFSDIQGEKRARESSPIHGSELSSNSLGVGTNTVVNKIHKQSKKNKRYKRKITLVECSSPEGVLLHDIVDLLESLRCPIDIPVTSDSPISYIIQPTSRPEEHSAFREVEVEIMRLGSNGDGIGVIKKDEDDKSEVVVVPFTLPGDKVKAKIYRTSSYYSNADFLSVISPSDKRDDSLVNCRYFGKCSGCQLQMYAYEDQLRHKREVIVRAYKHFCNVPSDLIPPIGDTIGSPAKYGYRTKLTPHFDLPRNKSTIMEKVNIGFIERGRSRVLDIEECPIGTPVLNDSLTERRAYVNSHIQTYKRGATILLRESVDLESSTDNELVKVAVTDSKQIVSEMVGAYKLQYPAGRIINFFLILIMQY